MFCWRDCRYQKTRNEVIFAKQWQYKGNDRSLPGSGLRDPCLLCWLVLMRWLSVVEAAVEWVVDVGSERNTLSWVISYSDNGTGSTDNRHRVFQVTTAAEHLTQLIWNSHGFFDTCCWEDAKSRVRSLLSKASGSVGECNLHTSDHQLWQQHVSDVFNNRSIPTV